ncbi:bacillithiol biosynthesis cysteine-adding enzyme BshC [Flavobacteriaceae bacterium F89]|uniref:Putative cysteine ligase BshC n=1 Tax=Cerina litoralis TaxID=2874477 RepID=A0AAE3EW69_9FLAO|nr:bacillithiol biosynthesis cysteine-adding enzyme BshC [Cerina litoralis]MCG2460822.1 bacillithiol biosynthesis cysteine-adding enzyme BshC [Cerina litoralis]
MKIDAIPFRKTGYFSELICDYIEGDKEVKPYFGRYPDLEGFKEQLMEKRSGFPKENREVLGKVLRRQYGDFRMSGATKNNISHLINNTAFTVTTGHQLNLFTGPLYFLYKIITAINLTRKLNIAYPDFQFVPVYWMATEDHDFEEINYFNFRGKKLRWNPAGRKEGAVGKLATTGLDILFETFSQEIGGGQNAETLKGLFKSAYLEHGNLTDATRYLANALFGEYGLVILDGDERELKKLMVPYVKRDLLEELSFKKVSETIDQLQEIPKNYGIQVNPREINYFYLIEGLRERIIRKDGRFYINNTQLEFSNEEIVKELNESPERFSPNVICRPLYQEVILPNLCYIGGGGELAYWLQLKSFFKEVQIPFPVLLLRNSALVVSAKQRNKLDRMSLEVSSLFLGQSALINKKIREISNINIDFSPQKKFLEEQFKDLYQLAEQTDKSFLGAVKAQEVKQLKGLDHLEHRLLKAQKRKLRDQVLRLTALQDELFPDHSLQERNLNFSELYLEYGKELVPKLLQALKPLSGDFTIIQME